MPDLKEINKKEATLRTDCLIEAKIDGTESDWDGDNITSSRGCNRNNRFPHIVSELRKIDWRVQMEIAVPFGNVHHVNKKIYWPKTRAYVFGVTSLNGQDVSGEDSFAKRRLLEEALRKGAFKHLRIPFKFRTFEDGMAWCDKKDTEGLVLKPSFGKGFKYKRLKEAKLLIVGYKASLYHHDNHV